MDWFQFPIHHHPETPNLSLNYLEQFKDLLDLDHTLHTHFCPVFLQDYHAAYSQYLFTNEIYLNFQSFYPVYQICPKRDQFGYFVANLTTRSNFGQPTFVASNVANSSYTGYRWEITIRAPYVA